jgi:hypothetical protein
LVLIIIIIIIIIIKATIRPRRFLPGVCMSSYVLRNRQAKILLQAITKHGD